MEQLRPLLSPANEGEAGKQSIPASGKGGLRGEAMNKHCHFGAGIMALAIGAFCALCRIAAMAGDFATHGGPVRIECVNKLAISTIAVGVDFASDLHGRIPRARCFCGGMFHTGGKLKRIQNGSKYYFQMI
jgi:hypothetical protein